MINTHILDKYMETSMLINKGLQVYYKIRDTWLSYTKSWIVLWILTDRLVADDDHQVYSKLLILKCDLISHFECVSTHEFPCTKWKHK